MGYRIGPNHEGWEGYMEVEREQLAQRASGKMARMLGRALPSESQEELDRIASEDRYLARSGYVELRQGDRVWTKHIDELTREDSLPRIEFEKNTLRWLRGRIEERKKIEAELGEGEEDDACSLL